MINKVIKSKAAAARVARELVDDLNEQLAIFNSYKVDIDSYGSQYNVTVTSPDAYSKILTGSCISAIMGVLQMYVLRYPRTNYHMDVVKQGDKYLPAFIICVNYEKE